MKTYHSKLYLFILFFLSLSSPSHSTATIITYESLDSLSVSTPNLVVEDWQKYPIETVLSNTSLNGITYPEENHLGEELISGCRYVGLWCINYLTESGRTRSFGSSPLKFGFEQSIDSLSLYLVQGTNGRGPGLSEWDIELDTGEIFSMRSSYGESDLLGLSYIGIKGIESKGFTVRQTRNDANVTWSLNHIGYQVVSQVPEPSTLAIFALGIMGLASRRFKKK